MSDKRGRAFKTGQNKKKPVNQLNKSDEVLEVIERLIYKLIYEGAYSNVLLNIDSAYNHLNPSAKKFVTNVVYGTLENWILLNYIIDNLASTPKKIKKELRVLLACGIYMLRFLDRKSPAVVVNRLVNHAKNTQAHAKGFVNLILRKYLREGAILPEPIDAYGLSINYSHPFDLVQFFIDCFGMDETISILKANNTRAKLICRVNTKYYSTDEVLEMLEADNVDAFMSDLSPYAIEILNLRDRKLEELHVFKQGAIYIQDISSILHSNLIHIKASDKIVDLCAAPGGKAISAMLNMDDSNVIRLCDINLSKLNLINENIKRLRLLDFNCEISQGDATIYNPAFEAAFDVVIADVPCSGLGVIRNRPEIRYSFDLENMLDLQKIQSEILDNAYRYLRDGGYLIYSTCTINPHENELQVQKFLARHDDMSICNANLDSSNRQITENVVKLRQSNLETDGFFACKIFKGRLE